MTSRRILTLLLLVACTMATSACGKRAEPAKDEPPSLNVTGWTDKTELYMEYPPLVAGRSALFAVHLTKLDDFTALNAGRPRIELTPEPETEPDLKISATKRTVLRPTGRAFDAVAATRAERDAQSRRRRGR